MATDVRTGQVDVGEFRENLDHFLESTGAVRVTRDGEIIGVYTPLPKPKKLTAKEADERSLELAKLQEELLGQMEKAGVTEEDLMGDIEDIERQKRARRP
jgi:hypothetical protein